ncbi:MAG: ParB/RepB/Spo0J family partition protein [Gammaproteobacteria bacterium]|nr:ParB/RepB/Spo0J family partition protein [Gammaproteobacteria bacterium]
MTQKKSRAAVVGMLDDLIKEGLQPVDGKNIHPAHTKNETLLPQPSLKNNFMTNKEAIEHIDPAQCVLWVYKDRPKAELGDIKELADDIKQNGQVQPGIVRSFHSEQPHEKYEIIIGERRWRACSIANKKFTAIIKNISDADAAIYQSIENDQRIDLSDYAKGQNYKKLLDAEILSQKDLVVKLQKSQSYIRNLLSFSRISKELVEAIGDMTKVSARTAYEIVLLEEKGAHYKNILLQLAPKISKAEIGAKKINKMVTALISSVDKGNDSAIEIKAIDGRHMFTWRKDSNGQKSIGFPKDIRETINFKELEQAIVKNILIQLNMKHQNEEEE